MMKIQVEHQNIYMDFEKSHTNCKNMRISYEWFLNVKVTSTFSVFAILLSLIGENTYYIYIYIYRLLTFFIWYLAQP